MNWYPAITEYGTPDLVTERVYLYARELKRKNPKFDDYRTAGQCPSCKAEGLISCLHHHYDVTTVIDGVRYQPCGNFCAYCGFSGSTSRMVIDE